ncbi:MAG: gfo/Idh/MocA family oxidoreductase [Actinomycetota bacterium]|nr:gfo/Idh/MocA family oxidoreductase [Actinomycetota bacterium]
MRFAIVGNGWRTGVFHRIAEALPDRLALVGVVTRREVEVAAPQYRSLEALVRSEHPDFVLLSVPWPITPQFIRAAVDLDLPVLAETPPAPDRAGLEALWSDVGGSGLVFVAEQYPSYPGHLARKIVVGRGTIGRLSSVQVSSTHEYHAMALIRGFLGGGFPRTVVRASTFTAPLADPVGRSGPSPDPHYENPAKTTIATLDFGDGMSGLYDFTDNQWRNHLRHRRIVIRGSLGEVIDDRVVRLGAGPEFVSSELSRRQTGYDLDLDGYDTQHIVFGGEVIWRNPFPGLRFSDEETAIADMLITMGEWSVRRRGPAPYSLAEGAQDHSLGLAINEAAASGREVIVEPGPWAESTG